MNITHILYSGLGGHASVFFSLVKGDEKKEFSVSALFCGIEEMRKDYITQCETLHIPYGYILKKKGLDVNSYKAIYTSLKKSKPDILFLHGSSFILPALFFKLFHRRTKLIIRDTQAIHLKSKTEWVWFRIAFYFSDHIVFLTKESMDGAFKRIGYRRKSGKGAIIPNGLDTDFYLPALQKQSSELIIVGMQSRLQAIKDHPTLLKAFALVKKKLPTLKLLLRIAGEGDTMSALQQLAKEINLEKDVDFCGMLGESDLLAFMHSLDIYVHASHGETMSNSIMQALACGLPVIASDVWGINNMIKDNDNAILYSPGDEHDLCEKIMTLINLSDYRSALSQRARAYALREFSMQQLFYRYKELF